MEIKTPIVSREQTLARLQINFIKDLQIGQQLQAKVLSRLPGENLLKLDLNGSYVRAKTLVKAVPGQILNLEVVKPGPLPQLKLLGTTQTEHVVIRTTRQLLPKQESSSKLQNQLLILTQNNSKLSALPVLSRPIVIALANGFPQLKAIIQPEGLKKAFHNSGLFLEKKLANPQTLSKTQIHIDTKAKLLRLIGLLKNTVSPPFLVPQTQTAPSQDKNFTASINQSQIQQASPSLPAPERVDLKDLLNQSEAALAKMVLNQLASVPNDENGKQIWQIELPFLNGQNAEMTKLRIIRDEENRETNDNKGKWTVVLQLNPPGLETINCKLSLSGEQVDAFFWSGDDKSTRLIKDHLGLLRNRFQKADLHPGRLGARCGKPPSEPTVNIHGPLVDEKV